MDALARAADRLGSAHAAPIDTATIVTKRAAELQEDILEACSREARGVERRANA